MPACDAVSEQADPPLTKVTTLPATVQMLGVEDAKVKVVKFELEVALSVAVSPTVAVAGALKVIVCRFKGVTDEAALVADAYVASPACEAVNEHADPPVTNDTVFPLTVQILGVEEAKVNVVKPELAVAVRVAVPPAVAVDGALNVIVCWINAGGVELPPPQAERINADTAAPASRVNE